MMLFLLSLSDASLVVYCALKQNDWQLAFDPQNKQKIYNDEKERNKLIMYQVFIENAIKADVLPAMQKAKGKSSDKKLFEQFKVPVEYQDSIRQYDYWIKQEDLWVFMERSSIISKEYAHGRDALARLLCALIDNNVLNEKSLNEHLSHLIETAETTLNVNLKLGDNTLKGCCREILETFSEIKNNNSHK